MRDQDGVGEVHESRFPKGHVRHWLILYEWKDECTISNPMAETATRVMWSLRTSLAKTYHALHLTSLDPMVPIQATRTAAAFWQFTGHISRHSQQSEATTQYGPWKGFACLYVFLTRVCSRCVHNQGVVGGSCWIFGCFGL